MEGLSSEAASLAGHLRLSALNTSTRTIASPSKRGTDLAFSEDGKPASTAQGWRVFRLNAENSLKFAPSSKSPGRD